eukprot:TRINITY_DN22640_c0_g1_i2.p1 TRINITY_DN22640_c0_g1~~TRINITY_DN22640_c0_g1_i2.p1  ORF type:complete len:448 (-),score=23.21 TRINITY_DN22640_c0_g1_i2:414-1598(-)
MAYVDGSDMIWMGCSEQHLIQKYEDISRRSGKLLVFGAELYCSEPAAQCEDMPPVPDWAIDASGIPDFASAFWPPLVECFQFGINGCDKIPSFRHLNSGFFMGPAFLISRLLSWVMTHFYYVLGERGYGHQRVMNEHNRIHQSAGLDYTASIVLNIDGLREEVVEDVVSRGVSPVTGEPLCFLHTQGGAKRRLESLILPKLRASRESFDARVARWRQEKGGQDSEQRPDDSEEPQPLDGPEITERSAARSNDRCRRGDNCKFAHDGRLQTGHSHRRNRDGEGYRRAIDSRSRGKGRQRRNSGRNRNRRRQGARGRQRRASGEGGGRRAGGGGGRRTRRRGRTPSEELLYDFIYSLGTTFSFSFREYYAYEYEYEYADYDETTPEHGSRDKRRGL